MNGRIRKSLHISISICTHLRVSFLSWNLCAMKFSHSWLSIYSFPFFPAAYNHTFQILCASHTKKPMSQKKQPSFKNPCLEKESFFINPCLIPNTPEITRFSPLNLEKKPCHITKKTNTNTRFLKRFERTFALHNLLSPALLSNIVLFLSFSCLFCSNNKQLILFLHHYIILTNFYYTLVIFLPYCLSPGFLQCYLTTLIMLLRGMFSNPIFL